MDAPVDGGPDARFDHVGIATQDAAATGGLFGDLLGAPVVHEETFEGMSVVFLDVGGGHLELLEPVEDGPVARFLGSRGPGVHHVAFRVEDVTAALAAAREAGIELVDEVPRPGAWGHEVAFLHPDSTDGVLVEFLEH
jgi:methylmalonyl-CoA/ethylmalonyl-CoA epimerase